eukprot:3797188-Pyramimonas_sp.AAC.1
MDLLFVRALLLVICEANGCAVVSADNQSFAWIFIIPARCSDYISRAAGSADDMGKKKHCRQARTIGNTEGGKPARRSTRARRRLAPSPLP